MSQNKLHVKTGDTVKVIAGNAKGQEGRVIKVDTKKQRVYVEGLNMKTKAIRKTQANQDGGLEQKEGPIHVSNIKLLASGE